MNTQPPISVTFINKIIDGVIKDNPVRPLRFTRNNPQGKSFYLTTNVDGKPITVRCQITPNNRRQIGIYIDNEWTDPWKDKEVAQLINELKTFCWTFYAPEEARLPS